MKNVAVVLSGCGVMDGSEIYESVLTLLTLDKLEAKAICTAPDIMQYHVINHLKGTPSSEKRNVLEEAARLARGQITPLDEINIKEVDAAIFPGGFGATKNLSTYAIKGPSFGVHSDVINFIKDFYKAGKPLGFICISPVVAASVLGEKGITLTIGNDPETAEVINALGAIHQECPVDDIVVDEKHKIVTTPAYMLGKSISDVEKGISKLVEKILSLT